MSLPSISFGFSKILHRADFLPDHSFIMARNNELIDCSQFRVGDATVICNNNNTPSDPTDDTFTGVFSVINLMNPNGTFTLTINGHSTQYNYDNNGIYVVSFGPYLVSGGDLSVTIVDNTNCEKSFTMDAPLTCMCPEWDVCLELLSEEGCMAVYRALFIGLEDVNYIRSLNVTFSVNNGSIINISYSAPGGYLGENCTILGTRVIDNGGTNLDGRYFDDEGLTITIVTEPGECAELSVSTAHISIASMPLCHGLKMCEGEEFCPGVSVGGQISTFSNAIGPCPDTQGLGIEGAKVVITNESMEICETSTNNAGDYECQFCEEGPYTVCVTTTCEEPCGLEEPDIYLIERMILLLDPVDPWHLVMADVNSDGQISVADIIFLLREILGIGNEGLENFNWCRFVPLGVAFGTTTIDENEDPYPSCITVEDPDDNINFIRFMVGDMNGSCDDCIHGDDEGPIPIKDESEEQTGIRYFTKLDNAGATEVYLDHTGVLYGFNFRINIGGNFGAILVESDYPEIMYNVVDGVLKVMYIAFEKHNDVHDANKPIFRIYGADANTMIVQEGKNYLFTSDGEIKKLKKSGSLAGQSVDLSANIVINHQSFDINIEKENEFEMELYDLSGRKISGHRIPSNSLRNSIQLNIPLGVYILHLKSKENNYTRKIFVTQ